MKPGVTLMSAKKFMQAIQPHLRGIAKRPYRHTSRPRRYSAAYSGRWLGEKRGTWSVWFFMRVPEGLDMFPDYIEVLVDDSSGEAWQEVWQTKPGRPAKRWETPPHRR